MLVGRLGSCIKRKLLKGQFLVRECRGLFDGSKINFIPLQGAILLQHSLAAHSAAPNTQLSSLALWWHYIDLHRSARRPAHFMLIS